MKFREHYDVGTVVIGAIWYVPHHPHLLCPRPLFLRPLYSKGQEGPRPYMLLLMSRSAFLLYTETAPSTPP